MTPWPPIRFPQYHCDRPGIQINTISRPFKLIYLKKNCLERHFFFLIFKFFICCQALATWCKEHTIDFVVVGPEDPLASGIVDALQAAGVPCFGPTQAGAQIEANKDWAKRFMTKHQIPTARYKSFTEAGPAKEFINTWVCVPIVLN